MSRVTISEDEMELILSAVSVPAISLEDLEISQEQIENNICYPAFRTYSRYFPKVSRSEHSVTADFEIPFPEGVHAVLDARIIDNDIRNRVSASSNPFLFERQLRHSGGLAGTGGGLGGRYADRNASLDSISIYNTYRRLLNNADFIVDHANRKLKGKVTSHLLSRTLYISWGSEVTDFNEVRYSRRPELIELCQANALRFFYNLRESFPDEAESGVSFEHYESRADDLEERVLEAWKENPNRVVILKA